MQFIRRALILLITLAFCGCNYHSGANDKPVSQTQLTTLLPAEKPIPQDLVITKFDKACCIVAPSYITSVFADGSVVVGETEYGTLAVKRTMRGKINEEDLRRLISEFDKSNYFSLNNKYVDKEDGCPEVWSDAETITTSIKIGGREKSIQHFWGCEQKGTIYPQELTELESKIDEIAGRWKLLPPESK